MYVALEGIDGCGKTSIIKKIKEDYPEVIRTREPGGSPLAEQIRSAVLTKEIVDNYDAFSIQVALLGARSDSVKYNSGYNNLISDRCFLSIAYSGIFPDSEEGIKLSKINSLICTRIPDPIIYLSISAETSVERLQSRKNFESYDTIDIEVIKERIRCYEEWITFFRLQNINIITVNANRSFQEVYEDVDALLSFFK